MEKGLIVLIVAGMILLVVAIQAFQLSGLVSAAHAAPPQQAVAPAPQPEPAPSPVAPSAPEQVGGC